MTRSPDARNDNISKTAAPDSNAVSYWSQYFGADGAGSGYGKLLVKKIPRRLKAALVAEMTMKAKKAASLSGNTPNQLVVAPKLLSGNFAPLAHTINESDGSVVIEGVFRGEVEGTDGSPRRLARLFRASFDKNAELTSFRTVVSP